MTSTLHMFGGHRFLGSRGTAFKVRKQIASMLLENADAKVVLDFAGIESVSHGFADELLTPLTELLNDKVPDHVIIANASPTVLEGLEVVARMHDLTMPAFAVP